MNLAYTCLAVAILTHAAICCDDEKQIISRGLVDISTVDSTIKVDLVNTTAENMLGKILYSCLNKAYLQPQAAQKLSHAQRLLSERRPGYRLKVLDATRPRSVQRMMWESVKGTALQAYIANPRSGSMHNYGIAVDVTIVDSLDRELDMGDPDVRRLIVGKTNKEIQSYFASIRLTPEQKVNRRLLSTTMIQAGFHPLPHEWWHFEAFEKGFVRANFPIIE